MRRDTRMIIPIGFLSPYLSPTSHQTRPKDQTTLDNGSDVNADGADGFEVVFYLVWYIG